MSRWLVLCMVCVLAVAQRAAADDLPDAATILARVSAATGTPPANLRTSVRVTTPSGVIIETTYRIGDDVRAVHGGGPIVTENGTYHGEQWIRNANGLVIIVEPDPLGTGGEAHTTSVALATSPAALVVSDLTKSGYGSRTFVDPVTSHVLRRERIEPNETITTDFQTYDTFGTSTVPMTWTVTNSRTRETDHFQRIDYTVGAATPADVVYRDSPNLIAFPPGVDSVTLPTTFVRGKIVVHATVGGEPFSFALDTGASSITISPALAQKLGLQISGLHTAVNAGALQVGQTTVPDITVGPLVMHNVVVNVLPYHSNGLGEAAFDGLLGFDFLAELGVRIDYDARTVTVSPGSSFKPPADKNLVPLDIRLGTSQPLISATFDGARADRMVFDTGGAGSFLLFDYFAKQHPGVFRNRLAGEGTLYGVGGEFRASAWTFENISIGALNFKKFTGFRVASAQSYLNNEDGLIGFDFLRYFTIWLDYMHGEIYLTPNRYHGEASR